MMTRQNDIPLNETNNNDVDGKAPIDEQNQAKSSATPTSSSSTVSAATATAAAAPTTTTTAEIGSKVPALIPLWDVANHANGAITTDFNPIDGQIEGATMAAVKKGEQIFIYYGNRNNANLLIHNGYVYAVWESPLQIKLNSKMFLFVVIFFAVLSWKTINRTVW